MNIDPADLAAQVARARAAWPFIDDIAAAHKLPPGLLLAVGSRETNLTDELGDGGHGHGVWQLDDRSHTIPDPYPVESQAEDAAAHLAAGFATYGSWQRSCAAYNSGQPDDRYTTGGDYGADCIARAGWIAAWAPTTEDDVTPQDKTDIINGVRALLDQDLQATIKGYLTDFWNGQFEPNMAAIKADVDAIKAKVGA